MDLTHTRLLVDDYKNCFLFYRDVLGFKVSWGHETSNYADFKVSDYISLGIFERKQMVAALGEDYEPLENKQDTSVLIFKVESVDQKYNDIKNRVDFITKPTEQREWGIKVAHFRDPANNLIEIYESLKKE